MLAADF